MNQLFDWQRDDYNRVVNGFNAGNYHAVILYPSVAPFVLHSINSLVAQYLLCDTPQMNLPCGQCHSCVLYSEGTHPDLFNLEIDEEDKANSIKVEQVRKLIEFTSTTAHTAKNKVVFIKDVSELTASINSSNSLLKILEEPPANCYFIINALDTSKILPTILSRASKIRLAKPSYQFALDEMSKLITNAEFWFNYYDRELVSHAPFNDDELKVIFNALTLPSIENIFTLLKQIDIKTKYVDLLEFVLKWLQDCMVFIMSGKAMYFIEQFAKMNNVLKKLNKDKLYSLEQDLVFLLEWSNHPLNHKLQIENVLLKYQQLYV